MIEKLAAGAISVGAVSAVGSIASESPYSQIAQWMPVATGVICAIIVWTITVMNTEKKRVWTYNFLVGVLTSIFTAVIVAERDLTPMYAMFIGIGAGGTGVGIINFAKPILSMILGKAKESLDKSK